MSGLAHCEGAAEIARVSAIVVTFNPNAATLDSIFTALRPQVERIVIVDNGSVASTVTELATLAARHACVLETLAVNLGIAAAQNHGVAVAVRDADATPSNDHFLLFLDHDSIPGPDMVERLLAVDAGVRRQGTRLGAVGPLILDKRTGTRGRFVRARRFWIGRDACENGCTAMPVDFLISSGTMTRLDVFRDVGGMNEGLFIDHVDTDWCLRAAALGYRLYGACDAHLTHSLGDDIVPVWLGRWREVFVHSPVRDYYVCRNTVLILRQLRMPFTWRLFLTVRLLGSIVFFGLGVAPRGARLRKMGCGLIDGFAGRSGALNA
ncbi:dTDP-rhamnosyl transferase RfbF (EC 2.-.-.-) [Caballeronia glathei]|uniref:Rhamnosyltransferase n=1 Tax=Caballeronia glathei TaxID=60547 RepID=A0A069PJ02_9BURK|nr:glycosyltransferase family 2 protein [Caballeronia glathei]KDR39909.1 rhamnosyltransferase [Caballeronia glathei]CEJ96029.1 dTDP-rhamnosyl transferase RfbF (EC 2.-.-.-) [Caballeronia glathei]